MPKTSRSCLWTPAWAITRTPSWVAFAYGRKGPRLGLMAMRKRRPPRTELSDGRLPLRRAGALRCDGRSRPQDDLPGTLCDGETRRPQGPGDRRRPPEVE